MRQNMFDRRLFSFALAALLAVFVISAARADAVELLVDPNFKQGLEVQAPDKSAQGRAVYEGTIQIDNAPVEPAWMLVQWGSRSSINGVEPQCNANGVCCWEDELKRVCLSQSGSGQPDISLAVDGNTEFQGQYRAENEPWPHLLVEQRIGYPSGDRIESAIISENTQVAFEVDVRLTQAQQNLAAGYDQGLHVAQFMIYFTIQNLNRNSDNYGQYLWLGIPVFDDRYTTPPAEILYDAGTDRMIYNIGLEPFTQQDVSSGQWVHLEGDLMPHILVALENAQLQGYVDASSWLQEFRIGSINMGWEVTGLNQVDMQVRNLSLAVDNVVRYEIEDDPEDDLGWSIWSWDLFDTLSDTDDVEAFVNFLEDALDALSDGIALF